MSAWGKAPSPWGKAPTATPANSAVDTVSEAPARVSLLDVMNETKIDVDEQASLALAQRLQFEEDSGISLEAIAVEVEVTPGPAVPQDDMMSDHDLALLLQAEFNMEQDRYVAEAELRTNSQNGNGKIKVSFDMHRSQHFERRESVPVEEGDSADEDETEELMYDKGHKVYRDADGEIVTKHNASVTKTANGRKMMDDLPLSFASGDTRKGKRGKDQDVRLNNKVYNSMMTYAVKNEKTRHRLKEKKDASTSDMALDSKTRLMLFRMVNAQILDKVNGAISTGKEAIVFHGSRHVDPEDAGSAVEEVAIKVFKTNITEFKQRQQFLHGDRRYENRVGRQSARKLVKLWAEKEAANLHRMDREGINCPRVVIQHKHVLVMSLIGSGLQPAPKLKEANLSRKMMLECLAQIRAAMKVMYHDCKLVHADLSEYNLLYHRKKVYFIDVGQSVMPTHPRADEFMFRDCVQIARFFEGAGLDAEGVVPTAEELFEEVVGRAITAENASQYVQSINVSKRAPKNRHGDVNAEDTSSICVTHEMEQELGAATRDEAGQSSGSDSDEEVDEAVDAAAFIAALAARPAITAEANAQAPVVDALVAKEPLGATAVIPAADQPSNA